MIRKDGEKMSVKRVIQRIIQGFIVIVGISLGITFLPDVYQLFSITPAWGGMHFVNGTIGGTIFFILSFWITTPIMRLIRNIEEYLSQQNAIDLLFGSVGTIIGLLLGVLVSVPLFNVHIPLFNNVLPFFIMALLAYLGFKIGTTRKDEWGKLFFFKNKKNLDVEIKDRDIAEYTQSFPKAPKTSYKLLDTSVIIDGRILDLMDTGFLEGILLIPHFVVYELQTIADSKDSSKRVRGRRGLDILTALHDHKLSTVHMVEHDFKEINEVDTKLIQLAKLYDATIITNDYNLNKVCNFQNISVLNINALAKALKPVFIPGEEMKVHIVKKGTERAQGVAYLDDGTMVVVEEGMHHMDQTVSVVVTSALQTDAGRMIFAKIASDHGLLTHKGASQS